MSVLSDITKYMTFSHGPERDYNAFFETNGCGNIAKHTAKVAAEADTLAKRFDVDGNLLLTAAYLHDLGLVIPVNQMIPAATELGIEIVDEERVLPGLLHQKLSKSIAAEVFGVRDPDVLNAIECHTTLKAGASKIDLMLFIADKLTWTSPDSKPMLEGILESLERSLEHAALFYINYLFEDKANIKVLHPWLLEADAYLRKICNSEEN